MSYKATNVVKVPRIPVVKLLDLFKDLDTRLDATKLDASFHMMDVLSIFDTSCFIKGRNLKI